MKRLITTLILAFSIVLWGLPVSIRAASPARDHRPMGVGELRMLEDWAALSLAELNERAQRAIAWRNMRYVGAEISASLPGKRVRRKVVRYAPRLTTVTRPTLRGQPGRARFEPNLSKFTFANMPAPAPLPLPEPAVDGAVIEALVGPPPPPPMPTVDSYPTAVANLSLNSSKTGYYRFTETSGTSIADSSGGSHTGTILAGITLNQSSLLTGDANPSALFDGGTNVGKMTSAGFMPVLTTGLSMAVLFKPTAWPAVNSRYLIAGTGTDTTSGLFQLYYQNNDNVFSYSFTTTTGSSIVVQMPVMYGTKQLNRTYHVVVSHDFATKTVKLYLDAMLVTTQTYTATPRTSASQPVQVGYDNVHGYIDEALFAGDEALTETEVRSLKRASVGADQTLSDVHVSTTGSYLNPGTSGSPIDLYTAFRTGLVPPTYTTWIHGGTYNTPTSPKEGFYVYGIGTAANPYRYKEYPGERAVIDGANMTLGGTDYSQKVSTIVLQFVAPAAYAELWSVEITNSNSDVANNRAKNRPTGVSVATHHIKMIDVWIYDTGQGTFSGSTGTDFECNSCLIFNNGNYYLSGVALDPSCNCYNAGHGFYLEHVDTTQRKLIKDTVIWGQASFGLHAFGVGVQASGMDADGVISFANGVWHNTTDASPGIAFVSQKRMSDNTVKNTITHTKPGLAGANLTIGKFGDPHEWFTLTGNKSFGGSVSFLDLAHVTWSNNLVVDTRTGSPIRFVVYTRPADYSGLSPTNPSYDVDHAYSYLGLKGDWTGTGNTYAGSNYTTSTAIWNENGVDDYNLAEWQALTNMDSNATIRNTTSNPYTSIIDYKPNDYISGRGFVSVFNPALSSTVSLDPSQFGISSGQAYLVRDVMNPLVNLTTGTYSGSPVSVSMTGTTVKPIAGYTIAGTAASKTSTEFKTFYVEGGTQAGPPVPTAPTNLVAAWSYSSRGATGNVTLTWTDTSSVETGFIIEKSSDGTIWSSATTTTANVVSYIVLGTTLDATSLWRFRIRSTNATGDSSNVGPVTEWATKVSCFIEPCTR